jgi:hypothetical protein
LARSQCSGEPHRLTILRLRRLLLKRWNDDFQHCAAPINTDDVESIGDGVVDLRNICHAAAPSPTRAGLPTEIAPIIYFLCTPEAHWINGADIGVDGGAGASAWRQMLNLVD